MKDFKFSKEERKELKALAPSVEWFSRYPYFHNLIDRIETLIQSRAESINPTPSVPSHYGDSVAGVSAEIILKDINPLSYDLVDTAHGKILHIMLSDILKSVTTYAASVCADKDIEIQEKESRIAYMEQYYNSSISVNGRLLSENKQLQSELADKDREIMHLTDQLNSARAEVERLKQTVAECEGAIKDMRH